MPDERRDLPDRRQNPRRTDDWRLEQLEQAVKDNTVQLAALERQLGDGFTNLIYHLDNRYMPRDQLAKEYVPRLEHQEAKRWGAQLRNNTALVIFAAAGWATTLIEHFLTH